MTFTFANAGSTTVQVPVELTGERDRDDDAECEPVAWPRLLARVEQPAVPQDHGPRHLSVDGAESRCSRDRLRVPFAYEADGSQPDQEEP